uniref:GrpB family protein n=1 Tax=Thaumasiovibrio occultus TaxID=1891184 RepID=UPI000B3638A4|nr:GrpB family protein [Thaumasiovibrio occultus]
MTLRILPYQLTDASFKPWREIYLDVAAQLTAQLSTAQFDVLHFGSTSAHIGGKGIIDLSLLYPSGKLDAAIIHLECLGFQPQHSQRPFPPTRPRKDGAVEFNGERFLIHVHVIEKDSEEHQRQVSYKEYMLANPQARLDYEQKKQQIIADGGLDQDDYGDQKGSFVKGVLTLIKG